MISLSARYIPGQRLRQHLRPLLLLVAVLLFLPGKGMASSPADTTRSFLPFLKGIRDLPISAGVGFGYYRPSLHYLNASFSTSIPAGAMPSVQLEVQPHEWIRGRLEVAYFTTFSEFVRFPDWGVERIGVRLIPIQLSVLVPYDLTGTDTYVAYAGLGGGLLFASTFYDNPDLDQRLNRTTALAHVLGGLRYALTERYTTALEARYVFGSYEQRVDAQSGPSQELEPEVSIAGVYLGFNFQYRF
jgi:hypothetical protein